MMRMSRMNPYSAEIFIFHVNALQATLTEFLETEGKVMSDGSKDDPELPKFEQQIAKYKGIATEIQALPSQQTMGWVKINAKPLRTALSTWVSKWNNLFTQYLQEKVDEGQRAY